MGVMGQTASLLAKAAPSLPHHSSIGSLSLPMTIFLEVWTSITNYEHIGPREISNAPIIPALTHMQVIIYPVQGVSPPSLLRGIYLNSRPTLVGLG